MVAAVRTPRGVVPLLAAVTLSLAGFIWITIRGNLPSAAWVTAAIAMNILAAASQAEGSAGFTLIWQFDHNGVFHLADHATGDCKTDSHVRACARRDGGIDANNFAVHI